MKRTFITALALCAGSFAFSQSITHSVVGTTGGNFTNASAQLTSCIGELSSKQHTTAEQILTEGFLQSELNKKIITGSFFDKATEHYLCVYPSPFSSSIKITTNKKVSLVKIKDITGVLVGETTNFSEPLDLSNEASGIYIIQAYNSKKELIETIKTIKL